MFLRSLFTCVLSVAFGSGAYCGHLQGGSIFFDHITGADYTIVAELYINGSSNADPEVYLDMGDGLVDTVTLNSTTSLSGDRVLARYEVDHTYPIPGLYHIRLEVPFRNSDIVNVPGSGSQMFCIEAMLSVSPLAGSNSSVRYTEDIPRHTGYQQPFLHDPGAIDPDLDSLAFELVAARGVAGVPIPGYSFPDEVVPGPDNVLFINGSSGEITWSSPQLMGEYVLTLSCSEYRAGTLVGQTMRDMGVTVIPGLGVAEQAVDWCHISSTLSFGSVIITTDVPGGMHVRLFDTAGRTLEQRSVKNERFSLDLSGMADACYVVQVNTLDGRVFCQRILKVSFR